MEAKLLVFFALAIVVAKGQTVTEIWLTDQTATHLSNPIIPKTISIPKFIFDTQVACHIIFPNGAIFETLPDNNLVNEFVQPTEAMEPFNACGVGFRNAPPTMSGTYELLSRVDHIMDGTTSLTRQKFHLTFYYSDDWGIPSSAQ